MFVKNSSALRWRILPGQLFVEQILVHLRKLKKLVIPCFMWKKRYISNVLQYIEFVPQKTWMVFGLTLIWGPVFCKTQLSWASLFLCVKPENKASLSKISYLKLGSIASSDGLSNLGISSSSWWKSGHDILVQRDATLLTSYWSTIWGRFLQRLSNFFPSYSYSLILLSYSRLFK